MPRLGLILQDEQGLRAARADDPVQLVLLRSTLFNPPRAAAARGVAEHVRAAHPQAAIVPYAWHLVTHAASDGLREAGTRSLPGEARNFGHLQDTPETRSAWEVSLRCAQEMGSTQVAVRTPASFTPGSIHQARLAAFVEARRGEGLGVVWEFDGLWESDATQALARKLDLQTLVPAFEGTGRPIAQSYERRWLRIDSAGATERLRAALAEALIATLQARDAWESVTILFSGPRAHANLRVFARLSDANELE